MKLLEPIHIHGLELKNRMVVSAMVTNYCTPDGLPTEQYTAYHETKARGGWGLVITEDYAVTPDAGSFKRLPGLWEDGQIPHHRAFTDRIHNAGGLIAAQIYHAGRETSSAVTGTRPVAPSAVKDPTMKELPRELTVPEIEAMVEQFGDCACRVRDAGFDAVEVHGAHGYLVGQFLSPFSNKRYDAYGGTIEGRAKFAVDIVKNMRQKCGPDFPILYRMSVQEYVHGGLSIAEAQAAAQLLERAGVDCFHCSQGVYASRLHIIPPFGVPSGAYADHAAAIKAVVSVPVIAVGRINDPLTAEAILQSGKADLCTMARASLADPDLPRKLGEGRREDILPCIGCLQGCSGENAKGNSVRCLVNPMTGMESDYHVRPVPVSKHVVVVGGGVAGCEAAITAAYRGIKVTLFEASNRLGGQWAAACVPPGKAEFGSFIRWQRHTLDQLGVKILFHVEADRETVEACSPDAVILATGGKPALPPIPGLEAYAVPAPQLLRGEAYAGAYAAVLGGGLVGAETAEHLAIHGSRVTLLELLPDILPEGHAVINRRLKESLQALGVEILTSAKVLRVERDSVVYLKDGNETRLKQVDTVVAALGVRSENTLLHALEAAAYPVVSVGDARLPQDGYLGIRDGFEAALSLF